MNSTLKTIRTRTRGLIVGGIALFVGDIAYDVYTGFTNNAQISTASEVVGFIGALIVFAGYAEYRSYKASLEEISRGEKS